MIRGIVVFRAYVLAGHSLFAWISFFLPVIMEVLIIADPVISLLVAEAEVVLLLPLIIKEPVVLLLIVGANAVALLIIEDSTLVEHAQALALMELIRE